MFPPGYVPTIGIIDDFHTLKVDINGNGSVQFMDYLPASSEPQQAPVVVSGLIDSIYVSPGNIDGIKDYYSYDASLSEAADWTVKFYSSAGNLVRTL